MRRFILAAIIALGVTGCSVTSTPSEPAHLTFRKDKLNELIAASNGAAHCGGYIIIDTDDREILVGGCDK